MRPRLRCSSWGEARARDRTEFAAQGQARSARLVRRANAEGLAEASMTSHSDLDGPAPLSLDEAALDAFLSLRPTDPSELGPRLMNGPAPPPLRMKVMSAEELSGSYIQEGRRRRMSRRSISSARSANPRASESGKP